MDDVSAAAAKRQRQRQRQRHSKNKQLEEDRLITEAIEEARREHSMRQCAMALAKGQLPPPGTSFDAAFIEAFSRFLEQPDAFLWCAGYLFVKDSDGVIGYPMAENDVRRVMQRLKPVRV